MKTGAAVLTALVIVAGIAWMWSVDPGESSTAPIAYVVIPIYALFAIIFIWLGVFVVWMIRRSLQKRRFATRIAKPL